MKTAYHMIQVVTMKTADFSGPEACLSLTDLVGYLIDLCDDLETICDYYENPDAVFYGFDIDNTLNHALYKLNGARGIIGLEPFLNDLAFYSKVQGTAAGILSHYIK